jgi:hypothetical protein
MLYTVSSSADRAMAKSTLLTEPGNRVNSFGIDCLLKPQAHIFASKRVLCHVVCGIKLIDGWGKSDEILFLMWRGAARRGRAWLGQARQGLARRGEARESEGQKLSLSLLSQAVSPARALRKLLDQLNPSAAPDPDDEIGDLLPTED